MRTLFSLVIVGLTVGCGSEPGEPAADSTQIQDSAVEASSSPFSPAALEAESLITGETIRSAVAELASDRFEGRGPGSAGDSLAREYLIQSLKELGLKPGAADGAWEQSFDLVSIHADQPPTWEFVSGGERLSLQQSTEFIVGSGVQAEQAEAVDAELVFVGFGIVAPEYDWDDYKGADLRGKVLVMLNNDPDWDADLFEGERRLYYGRWDYKYNSAASQGAVGAVIIHTTPSAGYPWQVVQTSWTGPQFELPAGDETRLQIAAWVTENAAAKLLRLGDQDLTKLVEAAKSRDFEPVALGVQTSIKLRNELAGVESANVLGLLPGGDPELADEVVIYTAHHDHLGIGLPNFAGDRADRIYNGARDNASGTGMVLNIAKAFTALPRAPGRSVLFAFVGAEEQGLLGSRYLAQNPTFPAGKIAGAVNFDSANIWGRTSDITFIGKGKSTLDQVADQVADYQGRVVKGDQFPDKGLFYRSDQFSLAKIGVPALYLSGGTEFLGKPEGWGAEQIGAYTAKNYHQPSDELTSDWNFEGLVEDARFGFWCGLIMAEADAMPQWLPGDEFEAARLEALAAD